MKLSHVWNLPLLVVVALVLAHGVALAKPRLLILTDIGGDPDDEQSLVRLLVHANDLDIEGIIASASGTPGELKEDVVRPDLVRRSIAAYGEVRPNLLRHDRRYPTAERLLGVVKARQPSPRRRQRR